MDILGLEGIFEQGYGFIAKKVMRDKELHYASKSIYAYICSYSGKGQDSFPSQRLMCSDLGMNKDTLAKHLKSLVEKGYITVRKNKSVEGKFDNNIYSIAILPLPKKPDTVKPDTKISDTTNNSSINNNINNNKIVNRSSQKNVTLLNYKNKKEYMNDVRKYIEFDTEITDILELFYDRYLQYNNKYNHYKIDKDTFETVIENLNKMYEFIDDSYQLTGKTTLGIMVEFTNSYFEHKTKHSIKNFSEEKTLMWFLTTIYKKHTDCELFFLAGKGKGRRFKDSLSDVI